MADGNTDLLNRILEKLDEQGRDIKTLKDTQQDQGTKLTSMGSEVSSIRTEVSSIRAEHGTKLRDLELKIEVINTNQQRAEKQAQKDHMELMRHLIDAADKTGEAQQAIGQRVDRIEEHLNLPPLK
jgi:septation ring formation regulator EzrA